MKEYGSGILIIIGIFLILGGFFKLGYDCGRDSIEYKDSVKTDTVERLIYICDTIPQWYAEKVIQTKYDTITKVLENNDTIQVEVPHQITQKAYSDDSTYTAYVSGCKPNLDSIFIKQKEITITNEVIRKEIDKRKFNVGLSGGYCYTFDNKNLSPYIGIGVTYTLFKF